MTSSNQDSSDCDSELGSLNSSHAASTETTAQRKRVRHRFSVWSFQLTISADATALNGGRASDSVTLQEQQKFLLEHVKSRILHTTGMPGIVTFVEAFYDSSILSGLSGPNIAGSSISIPLHGFVGVENLSKPEHRPTAKLPPCNIGYLLRGLQSRVVWRATRDTKISYIGAGIRMILLLQCACLEASA